MRLNRVYYEVRITPTLRQEMSVEVTHTPPTGTAFLRGGCPLPGFHHQKN
jgi:hypothetical protein